MGLRKGFLGKKEPEKVRIWRMGDAYEKRMVHHEGIKQLWESKWRFPVSNVHWHPSMLT